MNAMSKEMEITGERVIEAGYQTSPGRYLIYLMHMAAYDLALPFCRGKNVVELGCGTGYGAHHIAEVARAVHALDVSEDAIGYAQRHYLRPNLHFQRIDAGALPFPPASFDVALSFQVLEHVADAAAYLAEAARVLRPEGTLVLVTPDRRHRLLPGQRPWNRWHLREYAMDDLLKLVQAHFEVSDHYFMGLHRDVAPLEFRRYRLLKWASLPFTFPGAPEAWRQFGLATLHKLRRGRQESGRPPAFGPEVVEFGPEPAWPVNLVVVATPKAQTALLHG